MLYPVLIEPIKRREELNLKDINMSITKKEMNAEFWLSDNGQTLTFTEEKED